MDFWTHCIISNTLEDMGRKVSSRLNRIGESEGKCRIQERGREREREDVKFILD